MVQARPDPDTHTDMIPETVMGAGIVLSRDDVDVVHSKLLMGSSRMRRVPGSLILELETNRASRGHVVLVARELTTSHPLPVTSLAIYQGEAIRVNCSIWENIAQDNHGPIILWLGF